jgi:tetratricopeptide (TPR) repeat protein
VDFGSAAKPDFQRQDLVCYDPDDSFIHYSLEISMLIFRTLVLAFLFSSVLAIQPSTAQNMNLQPKYGVLSKNDAQKAADAKFIASIDDYYKGDRKKGSEDVSMRGWQFLRQGNSLEAMKRFNQAWLLDNANGNAIWGMAAIQAGSGGIDESLKLFSEAEGLLGNDIDFSVDYAKALGIAGAQAKNETLLKDAFARFARLYEKAPQHTLNLQNWAITSFYIGNYAEAWNAVKLAEVTPRRAELDPGFLTALQSKMPRP